MSVFSSSAFGMNDSEASDSGIAQSHVMHKTPPYSAISHPVMQVE